MLMARVDLTDGPGADLVARLGDRVRACLQAAGAEGEATAKVAAPVDTGTLRNSVTHELDATGSAVEVSAAAHYAIYVEMGTRRMAARPFMAPSLVAARQAFDRTAARELDAGA